MQMQIKQEHLLLLVLFCSTAIKRVLVL